MSRKRGKKQKAGVEAAPAEVLAEGSGPVTTADAIATVDDVATTADIATTEDVVTADDVVATAAADDADDADSDDGFAAAPPPPQDGDIVTAAELAAALEGIGDEDAALAAAEPLDSEDGGEVEGENDGAVFPTSANGMDAVQLKYLVESLVFASDKPLTVQRLRQLSRVSDVRRLQQALADLAEDYKDRGVVLQAVSGGYQFRTRTQFSAWVQQLIAGRPVRLSRAQLETLAIIAYRQPITRPEIDDIRGVDSSATLKLLLDRMLIRTLGKREEVGRPTLYGTTKEFLDFFSLGDLRELPTLREYSELTAESRKVMSDRLGIDPDDDGSSGGGGAGGGNDDGSSGSGGGDGGDDGGMGPPPGDGDDGASDDGMHAAGDPLSDALASYLAAADAVDRSEVAELADDDGDPVEPADMAANLIDAQMAEVHLGDDAATDTGGPVAE